MTLISTPERTDCPSLYSSADEYALSHVKAAVVSEVARYSPAQQPACVVAVSVAHSECMVDTSMEYSAVASVPPVAWHTACASLKESSWGKYL